MTNALRFSDLEIGDHFKLKRGYPSGVWIKINYVRRSMSYGGYDKLNGFAIQGSEKKEFSCNLIVEKVRQEGLPDDTNFC